MKSSTKNTVAGKAKEIQGKLKEAGSSTISVELGEWTV
jgi:hypothetical protein